MWLESNLLLQIRIQSVNSQVELTSGFPPQNQHLAHCLLVLMQRDSAASGRQAEYVDEYRNK